MKLTKKDVVWTAVGLIGGVLLGLGLNEVVPADKKVLFAAIVQSAVFLFLFSLLRFPAIAPKLHRNLVKGLGLKTDH